MSSKLESFLTDKKIDRRQLVVVSRDLESLRPEDRAIRLAKKRGAKAEDSDKKEKETRKPRSGKPVTTVALDKIFAGKDVSGPTRTRILRAVNVLLERKKHEKVELGALFDFTKAEGAAPKKQPKEKKEHPKRKK